MFCSKCGAEALEESIFCNRCGSELAHGFKQVIPRKSRFPISNTALLVASVAAAVALGAAFLPIGSKTDTKTEADQAAAIAPPSSVASTSDERVMSKSMKEQAQEHHNLGLEYYRVKKYDDAVRELEEAVKFDPLNATIVNNLGYALFKFEKYEESIVWLQKAIEIDPQRVVAYLNLADAYMKSGKTAEARQYYEKYAEIAPNAPRIEYVRKKLEELRPYIEPVPERHTVNTPPPPSACRPPLIPFNGMVIPGGAPFIMFQFICFRRPDAESYRLEIQYANDQYPGGWANVADETIPADRFPTFRCTNFNDPKPGRWKITVNLQDGRSLSSEWLYFSRAE